MSAEKANADLSEKELREYLSMLEEEDDNLELDMRQAAEELLPDEMLEDDAWKAVPVWAESENGGRRVDHLDFYSQATYAERQSELRKVGTANFSRNCLARKQARTALTRAACNQTDISLEADIPQEHLKLLISELVKGHTVMTDKLFTYINRRFTMLLEPLIPKGLRKCFKECPQSVLKCKGFMYKASEEYGKGYYFWATPDIPYYFTQGTEQAVLEELRPRYLFRLDKAIADYHRRKDQRDRIEIKFASAVVDRHLNTYFKLLRYNPHWFEALYTVLTGKQLINK